MPLSLVEEPKPVFKLFRSDPRKKLQKDYAKKLEQALQAQRAGKMPLFATLSEEAEEIARQLEQMEES